MNILRVNVIPGAMLAGVLAVAACAPMPADMPPPTVTPAPVPVALPAPSAPHAGTPEAAARTFVQVMRRMEPAVQRECINRRTAPIRCDFAYVVDDRPGLEPNAFQTVDRAGRPVVGFTLSLIAQTRSADEIAFVVGHESAHHILNHLDRKTGAATAAAVVLGSIASVYGSNAASVARAQEIGAAVGSRYYSRDWELEADYLGAIIALNAGYDPVNGSRLFERIPDPGNHILGTHPSRAQRLDQVRRAVADVQRGNVR
ncbi:M48 family metalloprotease [Paracoccus sp. (in: a-proteobacteria)]|uniref:M48 family metalloprotease n=1 Tax=Paracoccus sp. TaxID=267 RepID=UPI0026E0B3DB|nr:M48 family metalloprotease [Paracoccus sp. (in: a-proteobacteria)]MDO5647948.1 M48 family metalloprotease [Paracoccus sp. (in: a-proteobacteria)]